MSIGSLVAVLSALRFSAWQDSVQRAHNRISVRSHLFSFIKKEKHNDMGRIQVLLVSNGFGPEYTKNSIAKGGSVNRMPQFLQC